MNIGSAIKAIRIHIGMTQKELARLSGLSNSRLCDLETGRYNMRMATLEEIAYNLDVNISTIFLVAEDDGVNSVDSILKSV